METFRLDQALLRRRLSRLGEGDHDFFAREVARRMDERLDLVRIKPRCILDLGCGAGHDLVRLGERYPEAERIGVDLAESLLLHARQIHQPRLLRRLFGQACPCFAAAEAARLPLADNSVSLAWANLILPFVDDPLPVFQEMRRVTELGGLFMFSTLGPDTLRELREILPARVHRFIDMHDLGDALMAAGFSGPVMDMEMVTLTYSNLDKLIADLRANAANNAALDRPRGLWGRVAWEQARARLEQPLSITVELIQGHAWKPETRPDGRAIVHFHR